MTQQRTTAEWKEIALDVIKKHTLFVIEEVCVFMGLHHRTFYDHRLHEDADIKEAIRANNVTVKQGLRKKWYNSEAAPLQIALFKLIGTEDECQRLNGTKTENKTVIEYTTPKEEAISKLTEIAELEGRSVDEIIDREGIELKD